MKVDSAKSDNQIPKDKNSKVSPKSELAKHLAMQNFAGSNTDQTKKDFASILKSSSEQNENRSENKKLEKSNENNRVEDESKDSKTNSKEKKEVGEEKRGKSDSDGKNESEQDKGFGSLQIQSQQNIDEISIPNGRAILHVADLERIISKIRSQTVANGKQVTIELKQSVFEGLKLRITIGKDKSVIAEFLAANENVKSQLSARADELANLLKNRGVKLSKLQMSLDSQSDERNEQNQKETEQITSNKTSSNSDLTISENIISKFDSDTSYQA